MNNIHFWIEQQTKKVESSCYSAQNRIRNARTIREVKQISEISIPAEIKFMKNSIHGFRNLKITAENKIKDLIDEQLTSLKESKSQDDAKKLLINFLHNDWQHLRGDYAQLYRYADIKSHEIIHKFTKEQLI